MPVDPTCISFMLNLKLMETNAPETPDNLPENNNALNPIPVNTAPASPVHLQTSSAENVPAKLDKEGNVDLSSLSAQEMSKYSELNKSLQPSDVNSILNYGADAQNSMEKYSNEFLASVRTYNSGDVGVQN
jgi:uncharacterized protein YaaN involved in tellurite resistance